MNHAIRMFTPPQIAERLGVDAHKVCSWIKLGELPAVDVSMAGSRKPRWRIDPSDLDDFLARRRSRPPTPKPTRRRAEPNIIKFF